MHACDEVMRIDELCMLLKDDTLKKEKEEKKCLHMPKIGCKTRIEKINKRRKNKNHYKVTS